MARDLNGSAHKFENTTSTDIKTVPMTFACWVHLDTTGSNHTYIAVSDTNTNTNYFQLASGSTGILQCNPRSNAANPVAEKSGLAANQWEHVAGVFLTNSSRTAYLNGVGGNSNTTPSTPSGVDLTNVGHIRRSSSSVNFVNGAIAEAAIWKAALSAEEVAALASGMPPLRMRTKDLVRYWPIHGRTSPEPDFSGTDRPLTMTGTPIQHSGPPIGPMFSFDDPVVSAAAAAAALPFQPLFNRRTPTYLRM